MKLDTLSIARMVGKVLKNRDVYAARAKDLETKTVTGTSASQDVVATLSLATGRFVNVQLSPSIVPGFLGDELLQAVNNALEQADEFWAAPELG